MAVKSVLDIEVNDSAFVRYQESFKKYTEALSGQPDAWKKIAGEIDASQKSFKDLVAAAVARQGFAKLNAEAEAVAARSLDQQSRTWGDLAKSSKLFATNIGEATRSLLRWASVTTAVSGLLGVGGLWGIDRLAQGAASQRRSSTGLGISTGEEQAFNLNYGRIVDAPSVLSGVNESLTNVGKRGSLLRAGLTEQDISGKDAAQVSALLVTKLKALADQTPTQLLGNIVQSRGLSDLGISEQDLRRIKDRPASELADYERKFRGDTKELDLAPGQLRAWEDFKRQLDLAGATVKKILIDGLTPLAGPLGDLSKALTDALKDFVSGGGAKELIKEMVNGIQEFANFVKSGEFRKNIQDFSSDIGTMAHAIHTALGWIPEIIKFNDDHQIDLGPPKTVPGGGDNLGPDGPGGVNRLLQWFKDHFSGTGGGGDAGFTGALPTSYTGGAGFPIVQAAWRAPLGTGTPWGGGGSSSGGGGGSSPLWNGGTGGGGQAQGSGFNADFSSIEDAQGLPRGLLHAQFGAESAFGRKLVSSAGALGPFQFMRGTWSTYGKGGDINNLGDSAAAAGRYLHKLMQEFGGDTAKALAGYNWGEGKVEKDIAQHGAQWRQFLPPETKNYLNKILGQIGGGMGGGQMAAAKIYIYNNTGGSAVVQASGAAQIG